MLLKLKLQLLVAFIGLLGTFAVGYLIYSKGEAKGVEITTEKYEKVIKKQQDAIDTKVKNIETLATTLLAENRDITATLTVDVAAISSKVRGKVLTIVKEGKCTPTQTFSDTFNEINKRVNQSMKETK